MAKKWQEEKREEGRDRVKGRLRETESQLEKEGKGVQRVERVRERESKREKGKGKTDNTTVVQRLS